MSKQSNMAHVFAEGYKYNTFNPYLATSVCSDVWELGRMFQVTGRCPTKEVYKSRGDTYRVGDMVFKAIYSRAGNTDFERVQ